MPIYEYKCPKCGKVIEVKKSYSDKSYRPVCDVCNTLTDRKYSSAEICVKKDRPHGLYCAERPFPKS